MRWHTWSQTVRCSEKWMGWREWRTGCISAGGTDRLTSSWSCSPSLCWHPEACRCKTSLRPRVWWHNHRGAFAWKQHAVFSHYALSGNEIMWDFFFLNLKQSPVLQNKAKPLFLNIQLKESKNGNVKDKPFLIQPLQLFRGKLRLKYRLNCAKTFKALTSFSLVCFEIWYSIYYDDLCMSFKADLWCAFGYSP